MPSLIMVQMRAELIDGDSSVILGLLMRFPDMEDLGPIFRIVSSLRKYGHLFVIHHLSSLLFAWSICHWWFGCFGSFVIEFSLLSCMSTHEAPSIDPPPHISPYSVFSFTLYLLCTVLCSAVISEVRYPPLCLLCAMNWRWLRSRLTSP